MKKIKTDSEILKEKKDVLNKVYNRTYTDIRLLEWELLNELVRLRELIKNNAFLDLNTYPNSCELLEILESSINHSNKMREHIVVVGELIYPENISTLYDAVKYNNKNQVKNLLDKGIHPNECLCPYLELNLLEYAKYAVDNPEREKIIELLKEYGATQ